MSCEKSTFGSLLNLGAEWNQRADCTYEEHHCHFSDLQRSVLITIRGRDVAGYGSLIPELWKRGSNLATMTQEVTEIIRMPSRPSDWLMHQGFWHLQQICSL